MSPAKKTIENLYRTTDDALRPNGMTDEQVRDAIAALGRHKNDPEYLERVFGEAEKVRRRLNAKHLAMLGESTETPEATDLVDWAQSAIASIGCRKDDPEYVKELFDGAKEARRRINKEFLRELN